MTDEPVEDLWDDVGDDEWANDATRQFFEFARTLARARLPAALYRRVGPTDVAIGSIVAAVGYVRRTGRGFHRDAFKRLLRRILKRRAVDAVRRECMEKRDIRRTVPATERHPAARGDDPAARARARDLARRVEEWIERLPDATHRLVLRLALFEGFSAAEIADALAAAGGDGVRPIRKGQILKVLTLYRARLIRDLGLG